MLHRNFEATRQTLLKEASDLASALGAGAKHYLRVMEKVANGSEEYLEKESTRCVVIVSCSGCSPC